MKKGIMAIALEDIEDLTVEEINQEAPIDVAKGDELIDINQLDIQGNDIDDLLENINDNSNVVTTLESIANILSQSKDGLTPNNAKPLNTAIEHLLISIDQNPKVLPAMEAFGGTKTKLQATMESIEKIKEVAKNLWEKIKAWFQKLWNAIKNFYSEMTNVDNINKRKSDSLKDKIDECEKEVKEAVKVKKEEIKEIQKNEPEQYKEIIKETEIISKDNEEFKTKVLSLGYTKALELSKTHETTYVKIPEHLLNIIGYPHGTDITSSTFYTDFDSIFNKHGKLDKFLIETDEIYRTYIQKLTEFTNLSNKDNGAHHLEISNEGSFSRDDRMKVITGLVYMEKIVKETSLNVPFGMDNLNLSLSRIEAGKIDTPILNITTKTNTHDLSLYPEGISYAKKYILDVISSNKIDYFLSKFKSSIKLCELRSAGILAVIRAHESGSYQHLTEMTIENQIWLYMQWFTITKSISDFILTITKWINKIFSAALQFVNLTVNQTKVTYSHLMKSHGYIKDIEELVGTWF